MTHLYGRFSQFFSVLYYILEQYKSAMYIQDLLFEIPLQFIVVQDGLVMD